jgi:hypothetical protein
MPALMLNRSSRVMPGLRGTPAATAQSNGAGWSGPGWGRVGWVGVFVVAPNGACTLCHVGCVGADVCEMPQLPST